MSLFKRATHNSEDLHDPREHEMRESVVVYLPNRLEAGITDLEKSLCTIVQQNGLGFCGSTEQEDNDVALYFYGPLAHPLFAAIKPLLLAQPDAINAHIKFATGFRETRTYTDFRLIP
jgi:hypothetical protein